MTNRERESLTYTVIMGGLGIPLWLFNWFPSPCGFIAIMIVAALLVGLIPDKKKKKTDENQRT